MKQMKKLHLSLKKQWFEMTKAGIKTEDYREINSYWNRRLYRCSIGCTKSKIYGDCQEVIGGRVVNSHPCYKCEHSILNEFTTNVMTLGYPKSTDTERILRLEQKGIEVRTGNADWGAEEGKLYFVIKHGFSL